MPKDAGNNGNIEIILEDVRCSYPNLFEPKGFKNDKTSKPRFTCGFILDKKKHADLIEEIETAIADAKFAKWGKNPPRIKFDNMCFQDGDDLDKDEYQGCYLLKAAAPENRPPAVLGRDKAPLTKRDGKPYGGCYVNAIVRIYAYDTHQDQINASLEAVQYFRKGPSFGAGPADTSKLGSFDEEDEEEFTSMRDRKRGRDRDEDEDDRPRSRRGRDEDEDEKPARRASRSRDEDEDEKPRSRRASRDDDDDRDPPRRRSRVEEDEDDAPRSRRRSRDDD